MGRGAQGEAPSASRTPPPGSALPRGKSPPASFQKKDAFAAGEGVNSEEGLRASVRRAFARSATSS